MGCAQSDSPIAGGATPEELDRDRKIEDTLVKDAVEDQKHIKLLLLGAGDSGKTTLRKQMRSLYGQGFSREMKLEFAPIILSLLATGFADALEAMTSSLGLRLETPEGERAVGIVVDLAKSPKVVKLDEEKADAMKALFADPGFGKAIARRNEYQLQDCWSTFMEELTQYPAWGGANWIPSVDDCIACRVRTSGIQEEVFNVEGVDFKVFDVGGQRSERRKWLACFDNVTAIIFVAAISEYDQKLFEDPDKNRLEEAVELFEDVCNNSLFEYIDVILFLNKRDLFEKKYSIEGVPFDETLFPGAPKGNDLKAAYLYLENLFLSRNRFSKKIHVHMTAATDSGNIKLVFDACKDIILHNALKMSGF